MRMSYSFHVTHAHCRIASASEHRGVGLLLTTQTEAGLCAWMPAY